jgi:hypothetical protein
MGNWVRKRIGASHFGVIIIHQSLTESYIHAWRGFSSTEKSYLGSYAPSKGFWRQRPKEWVYGSFNTGNISSRATCTVVAKPLLYDFLRRPDCCHQRGWIFQSDGTNMTWKASLGASIEGPSGMEMYPLCAVFRDSVKVFRVG